MKRDLSTPVWAIETYGPLWLTCGELHVAAFEFYRDEFYSKRPAYSWGSHVGMFHQEVVTQARLAFDKLLAAGQVTLSNDDERFEVHLEDGLTRLRFNATHQSGFPNMNDTKRARQSVGQHLLYVQGRVDDEAVLLVGCELDHAWETPPAVSIKYFAENKQVWTFPATATEMERVLAQYRRAG